MILVAGGTGRLGTLVVERLATAGLPVRVLTRDPRRAAHLGDAIEVVQGDVRHPEALGPALEGVDVAVSAFHGFVGPRGVSPATVDRDGNFNLIDAAAAAGVELVLLSMVGASADNPMELARMKFAAEEYAWASNVPTTVVRCTAFMELWIDLLRQTAARSGRPLVFGKGHNPINFVSVSDVAAAVERVVRDPAFRGKTLEMAGPANLTFNELAEAVRRSDGQLGPLRHVPRIVLRVMAEPVGLLNPQIGRQMRTALVMDTTDLTYKPTRSTYSDLPHTDVRTVLSGG